MSMIETSTEELVDQVEIAKKEIEQLITIAKVRRLYSSEKFMLKIAEDNLDRAERILKMRNWRAIS